MTLFDYFNSYPKRHPLSDPRRFRGTVDGGFEVFGDFLGEAIGSGRLPDPSKLLTTGTVGTD
jgi:hypothetical protein